MRDARPSSRAQYMASSAFSSTLSAVSPAPLGSVSTIPTVGRTRCSTPCTTTGRAAPSRMRLAMRRASASECTSAHTTTNLSLATRDTMSVLRRATDSRLATSRATCSAAPAPNCWFTSCQPSSSTNEHGQWAPGPLGACQGPAELLLEQGPVGRFGEDARRRARAPRPAAAAGAGFGRVAAAGHLGLGGHLLDDPAQAVVLDGQRPLGQRVADGLDEGLGYERLHQEPVEVRGRPPGRCRARPGP